MIDLSDIPVVDNHVHPWRATTRYLTAEQLAGCPAFSEGVVESVRKPYLPAAELEPALRLFRETSLGSAYLLGELARFLGVESKWETVAAARNAAAAADYRAWTARLFADAAIDALLVDEGGAQPRITLDELGAYVPARLRRVARSDNFIRDLLPQTATWAEFFQRYQQELQNAIDDGAIAFKSVIAYRTGLDVEPVSEDAARQNFEASRTAPELAQKTFRDFLLCHTMDVARERGLWLHIHAGVGDPDIVYQRANPALLYPLLHSERFRTNRVVLVHGGWPWVGEAAAMVAILPNVYLDVSEGTLFGMPNVRQRMLEALEACPYSKILYGADGSIPEALWITARRYKHVLGRVLAELVDEGFCTQEGSYQVGQMILHDNAARLYEL
ncbi:MAG TPA: amidohydrolase family protein [Chloroflexota bacterium]|nr:amidohydrolase family protein [Chloroflexota bacterium]